MLTAVGNSGTPGDVVPPLTDDATSASGSVVALAVDPAGNLYTGSAYEENSTELRRLTPDGKNVWNKNGVTITPWRATATISSSRTRHRQ